MKKIAIIGHFGGKENFFDGQTIKTKNLERILLSQSDLSIKRVDTYYSRNNKIKLLVDTIKAVFTCEHIFLLVSVNGMRVYLPLLYYINRLAKKHIYHYIIGSELLELVEQDRRLIKYLNAIDANWFEYDSGTKRLQEYGVTNASTVPNFKDITPVLNATAYLSQGRPYQFCTFSRVMREKGITDAINAIAFINEENERVVAQLDVYGPIDPAYKEEFDRLLILHSDCIVYKGITDSEKSVNSLKDYYALLFPTQWPGEGLPGTIIDAFAAGIPIIATDWNANKEIIHHNQQGIIYPNCDMQTLKDAINWAIQNTETMDRMRIESRKAFERYTPNAILQTILSRMNGTASV